MPIASVYGRIESISLIPEPPIYAFMLVGIGLLGFQIGGVDSRLSTDVYTYPLNAPPTFFATVVGISDGDTLVDAWR